MSITFDALQPDKEILCAKHTQMIKYTEEILKHIGKRVTMLLNFYNNNYQPGDNTNIEIKFPIDKNIIKIADDIYTPKSSNFFNFITCKENNDKIIYLLKSDLEKYIQDFQPHWNKYIRSHNIVINSSKAEYNLIIYLPIGIIINDYNPRVIHMKYNDHMNIIYYQYITTELNNIIEYITNKINDTIKNNIVPDNKYYIDVIGFLAKESSQVISSFPETDESNYDNIHFHQENMINILKLYKCPSEFKTIDHIYTIMKIIKYIYATLEKYYNNKNMKVILAPYRPDIINVINARVSFAWLCIELL